MSWEDIEPEYDEERGPGPDDDPAVQALEPELMALFDASPDEVFYETQLCVRFEKNFFHWVTSRALKDLRESNRIVSELQELSPGVPLRFYFSRRNRYWRRRATEMRNLVREYSHPTFTNSLGVQGEILIDAGLPRVGFLPADQNVSEWQGRTWDQSNHDLDRVFIRDGVAYGAEIKNRLGYIDRDEFRTKLAMCLVLDLVPLFVARMMPKTYIEDVRKLGGFCLIMGYQFYPVSHRDLANRVKEQLKLPVDCPTRLQDSTLQRFLNWHLGKLARLRK